MATLCTNCGTALKDGARYCNNCGTLVPSHPLSPQSLSATSPPGRQYNYSKGREQIEPMHRSSSPARELHVRVWEQKEPGAPDEQADKQPFVGDKEEDGVEDLPTRPLAASFPGNVIVRDSQPPLVNSAQNTRLDEVEQVDTVSLPAYQRLVQPARSEQIGRDGQRSPGVSSLSPIKDLKHVPPPQALAPPSQPRKSRKSLVIALISLLLLLIVGGAGAWIVVLHPFSVPSVTQPQQTFRNTQLGFSLLYPNGWESQVDSSKATAHFFDSTHTAQVNVVVGSPGEGNLSQSLQQQAGQLGMTGQKTGAPLSFAGASWQHMQGNVILGGASYTGTLLVTVHHAHLFTIILLAPQTTYVQEEQLVFSGLRSSFQFIS